MATDSGFYDRPIPKSPHVRDFNWLGILCLALALIGGALFFVSGSIALGNAWLLPEYSHGPLIPVLSFLLYLNQLKGVPPVTTPVNDRWPGAALLVFSLLIALAGNMTRIPDIVTYAMILWVFGLLLINFGWRSGRQFWPPVVHLVFMLPLPAFIYWKFSIELQFIASEIGVWLIRLMDIPVFLEGNIIDLGVYKLHVAEACSGLRYLFPILSFSYIFALLYNGSNWIKAILLLSAAPITIVMNSFRIGVIGVLVDNFGIEHAEGFLHLFEGWVIFIACVAILFGLARLMQRISGDRRSFHDAFDLDFTGLWPQFCRVTAIQPSGAMIVGAIASVAAGLLWYAAPAREIVQPERTPLALFARDTGSWTAGPSQQLEPQIEAVLGADDYYSATYSNQNATAPIDLFIAYYHKLTEGQGIHSPEVCIPTGGWEMSKITQSKVTVTLSDGTMESLPVNRAVIQKGLSRQLVYYWFEQRGRRMTSDYVAKAMTVLDAITRGRTDGALMRILTPIAANETEAQAEQRLDAFLGETIELFPQFVPE